MSEAQKSTMGPKRLFILLALGAVVFYFLADKKDVKDSEDVEQTTQTDNLNPGNDIEVELNFEGDDNNGKNNKTANTSTKKKKAKDKDAHDLDYVPNHNLNHEPDHSLNKY